jgi:hypothetical protein
MRVFLLSCKALVSDSRRSRDLETPYQVPAQDMSVASETIDSGAGGVDYSQIFGRDTLKAMTSGN